MMNEIRVIAYNDLARYKILIPNCLFFFLENKKEAIKTMYTVVSAIEIFVQFKDVHGVAFCCDMDHDAVRQKCMTLVVAIMMLITGALGLCREHTK